MIFSKISAGRYKLAWHNEIFDVNSNTNGNLGRENKSEVILQKNLLTALETLNLSLLQSTYKDACLRITQCEADKTLDRTNKEKYELIKFGIKVSLTNDKGEIIRKTLKYSTLITQIIITSSSMSARSNW